MKLMKMVALGPNAFLPMSVYVRNLGSLQIIRARILALRALDEKNYQTSRTLKPYV